MINKKPLTIAARDKIIHYFSGITNSMYNFTTAFMWRGDNCITYDIIEDCLVLFYNFPNRPPSVSYPIGDGNKKAAVLEVMDYLESISSVKIMRNLSPEMADELKIFFPDEFEYICDKTASDYIYESEKLISLSGKALHAKRNHYNYFKKNYEYEYKKMTQSDAEKCKELFDRWINEKDDDIKWLQSSRDATFAALDNFDALNLCGGIITVSEEIAAFSVGEALTDDMALIHLELASPDIRGAFNAINHDFCQHEWSKYTYINREEDMGLPGLKRAKESYRPVYMLDKYDAVKLK